MLKQQDLFKETTNQTPFMSIEETADFFSVSSATIRNWVKTGNLYLFEKGKIDKKSIFTFKAQQIGKNKLIGRANKSQKDSHNHRELSLHILRNQKESAETLGNLYENSLSDSYRNKEGIYYTPDSIVDDLFVIDEEIKNKTFCDPCCGSGNFIIKAIELGFSPELIFGFDTDPIAVEITKRRIKEKTGYDSQNIHCLNFLEWVAKPNKETFDYIFTNPPWGKKIGKKEKDLYASLLNTVVNNDTCSLFFSACLLALKNNGRLGLVLPEAFFNISSYANARKELLKYQINWLKDYGKAFKGLQTGVVAFSLVKKQADKSKLITCLYNKNIFKRTINSFINNPKWIFNLNCNENDEKIIYHLLSQEYKTLENNAKWGLGIVTGNNKKYLKTKYEEGLIPVYKGSDITLDGLKDASNFISDDFSQYQQVSPLELFNAKEKIIYRFISPDLKFYYDSKQHYVLNSANMIIVNDSFPVSMKTLTELFNSDFMNWLFKKIFNTHKVLKGDLEKLPIFTQFLENNSFNEELYLSLLKIEKIENGTYRIKN